MTRQQGLLIATLSILFLSMIIGAEGRAEPLRGKVVVTGSSTVAPLVAEIGKRFESLHAGVRIDVQMGGSSRGIADARQGLADIGMVSRKLFEDEQDLHGWPIARDGIGIILHASNPVSHLGHAQIVDIYTGTITNWKAVGGHDAPITVVHKASGRATLDLFLEYFELNNSTIKAHVVVGDNEQGIKTVAGNPDAIGYVSIGTAAYDLALGVPINVLPIGGVPATLTHVRNGTFPLSRHLTLVTKEKPAGLTRAFIEFARSEKVHDIIAQQYFVPVSN